MTKEEMRLEALRLAMPVGIGGQEGQEDLILSRAARYASFLIDGAQATYGGSVSTAAPATAQPAAPQPAPAPQPGAATATVAQCAEAFQRHVKKGGGRSAMTARKAVTDALPAFQNFQALTPEECATAVAAMDRATDAA